MLIEILLVLAGLVILLASGEILVRGAVDLAHALNIPALIVSVTIVAFGTSAPEMVVSYQAVLSDAGGIALGNIIGSNIANILMVLGIPALIYPISTQITGLSKHTIAMLAATGVFAYAAYVPGAISVPFGAILFCLIILYVLYMVVEAVTHTNGNPVMDDVAEFTDGNPGLSVMTFVFIIGGLVGLPIGAHLLVSNGASLAAQLGVREAVIGLTVVAFGTSLPELATVLSAALKKKSDVAVGSIIGSNIFNLLAVGGITGLAGGAAFDPASLRVDIPFMVFAALILSGFVLTRRNIGRLPGIVMAFAYIAFVVLLATLAA